MHIIWNYWNNLPIYWKELLFKEWLYFIHKKESLKTFLWDDSYGLDFLLCKSLNIESENPNLDLIELEKYIKDAMNRIDTSILLEIFDMEFVALDREITYISPLRYFRNLKIVDFHCTNESQITDFYALKRETNIYVLDYADYQIIDFDRYSNIGQIKNIKYIKEYGWPNELDKILNCLINFKLD